MNVIDFPDGEPQPLIDRDVADLEVRDAILFMAKHVDFGQARGLFKAYMDYIYTANPDALFFEMAYLLQSYAAKE